MEIVFIVMNGESVVEVYNNWDAAFHFLDCYPDECTQVIVRHVLDD